MTQISSSAASLPANQVDKTLAFLGRFTERHHAGGTVAAATFARGCLLLASGATAQALQEAEELARWISEQRDPARLDLDPLILSAYALELSREGALPAMFEKLALSLADALEHLSSGEARQPRTLWTASLLRRAGIPVGKDRFISTDRDWLARPEQLLTLPDDELSNVIDVLAATGGDVAPARWTLSLLCLALLRSYRVEIATKILRLLLDRDMSDELTDESLNFIALQRCSDGGYGFADPFLGDDAGLATDLEFRLPITVNACWLVRTAGRQAERAAAKTRELA